MTVLAQQPLSLFFVIGLAGCAATRTPAPTADYDNTDLNGFTRYLQEHGVYVTEHGPANLRIPADASRRLVLDRRDVVDVYHFRNEEAAEGEALAFAALYPRDDV